MRPFRAASAVFRMAFAVMFGFVSLAHGPVMAFAKESASAVPHHMAVAHVSQAADGTPGDHQSSPAILHKPAVCYSFGCFVAVESTLTDAPAVYLYPLEELSPALARAIVAALLKPVDPPPRLQA